LLATGFPDDASVWGDMFVVDSVVGVRSGVCVAIVDGSPAIDGRKGAMRRVWAATGRRQAAQVLQDAAKLTSQAC